MATKIFPEFQFQWLVDQIKANLPLELDFLNEGKNCEKMRDVLTDFSGIRVSFLNRGKSLKSLNFFFVSISIDEIGLKLFKYFSLQNFKIDRCFNLRGASLYVLFCFLWNSTSMYGQSAFLWCHFCCFVVCFYKIILV